MAPEILADQYDIGRACYVVAGAQIAADLRFEAKHRQKSRAGTHTAEALRRAEPCTDRKIDRFASGERDVRKPLLTCAPVEPVHVANRAVVKNARGFADED